ncbi:MAG: acetyl-CoA carboxylase, biotin carboxyl carrier protein [Lachnospiraceae bacterium]|nr:acetyl-CoA carboxylase, biotin carboxyl carrier protein [Lachnospiraceae bacterium]
MESLKECAELFEQLKLTELCIEENGRKICLKKQRGPVVPPMAAIPMPAAAPAAASAVSEGSAPAAADRPDGDVVKAPLLGIFHASAGGTVRAEGDIVKRGDVLCTIEAMKMMNEVSAPRDGVIRAVLVKDGALVEYHQDLFVIA